MALSMGDFEQAAETLVERTAELLSAQVAIVDERSIIVASSRPVEVGRPFEAPDHTHLTVPLHLEGRAVTIFITPQADGDEDIPPRLTRIVVDLLVSQTTVVDRLPNKRDIKNKLIHDLLHGDFDNEAAILREAQVLGMDLSPPRQVLLIGAGEYIFRARRGAPEVTENETWQRSQVIIGAVVDFFELPSDTICAYIGNGDVAVLKASNRKNLGRWAGDPQEQHGGQMNPSWANLDATKRASNALLKYLRRVTHSSLSIGIGRHHPGLRGLSASYEDALAALSLGRRILGSGRVHCLDSLGVAAFVGVADEQTKIDLATYLLGPLDHEPDLLRTLNAFFACNCVPSDTARELCVHRNTLSYRLGKIASLTGLDPRRFEDAVQIRLAMTLRSFTTAS